MLMSACARIVSMVAVVAVVAADMGVPFFSSP
jgi:hypothetical protein